MESDWVARKIGSLGKVVTGKTPPTKDIDNFGGPFPFITIPDLDGRRIIKTSERTLSEKGAQIMKSMLLPAGAVMMSCIATVGKCGMTDRPSFTNQQINSVIPGQDIDGSFLYYLFTQLGREMEAAGGGGSVYTNVSKSRFSEIEVTIPKSLTEQRRIAHILGTFDDKIELNRRMNATLEAMARALFQSWFVDFDPVRAKMDGRWRKGESLPGLPAAWWDLFPDRLVDSELGPIPDGWRVGTVGEVAKNCGQVVNVEDLEPGIPYIGLEHLPKQSLALSAWGLSDNLQSSKKLFSQGDILFGKLRPYFHKVCIAPVNGVCSTDILVIEPKETGLYSFVTLLVSSIPFIDYTSAASTGTRMPRTSWDYMKKYECLIPPEPVFMEFDLFARIFFLRIIDLVNNTLTEISIRDCVHQEIFKQVY